MKKLTKSGFESARIFLLENARPLEVAKFNFHFKGGSQYEVLEELSKFQNKDGGFGNALEPDVRTPYSSALCTCLAFRDFQSLKTSVSNDMVRAGIKYLLNNYNKNQHHWRIIPPSASDYPHAPWWNQKGREKALQEFSPNPTAEILGYLLDYADLVPQQLLSELTNRVQTHIESAEQLEMHELLCFVQLVKSNALPPQFQDTIQIKLETIFKKTIAFDPARWTSYSLRPLQVVNTPSSVFHPLMKDALQTNLDFEIDQQSKNGAWMPSWNWGEDRAEEWAKVQLEWAGMITIQTLLALNNFDRIERLT